MKYILNLLVVITFISCAKKEDPFLISKNKIGLLTKETTVKQLDSIFKNDSVVKRIAGDEFTGIQDDIEILDKNNASLLALTPNESLEDNTTFERVNILSSNYKTLKGLSIKSKFIDFKNAYEIKSIDRLMNNVVIQFKNENLYITIDIDEFSPEIKLDYSRKIDAINIPDNATIKYLMLDWK